MSNLKAKSTDLYQSKKKKNNNPKLSKRLTCSVLKDKIAGKMKLKLTHHKVCLHVFKGGFSKRKRTDRKLIEWAHSNWIAVDPGALKLRPALTHWRDPGPLL